jgi:chromosome segregation ATPase
MTTAPTRDEATQEELDERTHDAWSAYRESLRDLSGRDYDDAETRSWERLQQELQEIEERRAELAGVASGSR